MTDGLELGDVYSATVERIKAQDEGKSKLGVAALMWVSHAERPLRADELCHALAVELGSKDFSADNAPSISTLVGCCQGLITVDKETSTVRLVHPTVIVYLSTRPDVFSKPHAAMAEICLTYLNSEQVKALSADSSAVIHDKPFLEYCSVYWGIHAKRDLSDHARSLALEVLREYDGHISSKLLLKQVKCQGGGGSVASASRPGRFAGPGSSSSFSGLHCASFFGIVEVVATLIGMEGDINSRDDRGSTPLVWAARNGHEEVVEMFLRRQEVQPDQSDLSGLTPLLYAIQCRHERVVEILLKQIIVDPDRPDRRGETPLSYATQDGLDGVVKVLLGRREVNPDKEDLSGNTPLSFAAENGHVRVVEILLGRHEVNPNKPDNNGQTPLMLATGLGFQEVITLLLSYEEEGSVEYD